MFEKAFLFVLASVASCGFPTPAAPAAELVRSDINWPAFLARQDPVWEQFPTSWNTGGFVGNGELGMMVHATAADNRIDFHLGRTDVTDHRKAPDRKTSFGVPGASLQYDYPRLDVGRMALRPAGKILSGSMRLVLWNAELTGAVQTDLGVLAFRAFVPRDRMVDVIEVSSTEQINGRPAPWRWEFLPGNPTSPRRLVIPQEPAGQGYQTNPPPQPATVIDGVGVRVQPLLAGGDYACGWREKSTGEGRSILFVSVANEVPRSGASAGVAARTVLAAVDETPSALTDAHRAWWHAYYPASFLSVPDARVESFYWIQLYKFASASRADGPLIDCLGPFYRITQWPGAWWNLNVQLTYWLPLASNHLDLGRPLVDEIDRYFDAMLKGACAGPAIGDFAWALHNYWLQYRYAGDRQGLRDHWLPKGAKLADCYLSRLVKGGDGKLHLPQTQSPEYPGPPGTRGFGQFDDSNYNLALLRWLLRSLLEAAEGSSPDAARWRQTLQDLTSLVVGPDGLMIGKDQPVAISHRHYSHLLALYPLFQLDPDDPADRGLVDRSVTHWHEVGGGKLLAGYSFTGAASLYAALGRGDDALTMLKTFLQGKVGIAYLSQNTFYFETGGRNPVIETPLSGAAAISQMLLQSWGGKLRVFPAVPTSWADASFHDLRAEGGFLVSAQRTGGQTAWVAVQSLAGESCVVKVPDWGKTAPVTRGGRHVAVEVVQAGEFALDLHRDESVVLSLSDLPAVAQPVSTGLPGANSFGVKRGETIPAGHEWPES